MRGREIVGAIAVVGAVGLAAYTEPWYTSTDTVQGVVISGEGDHTALGVCPDSSSRGLIAPIDVWTHASFQEVTDAATNNRLYCRTNVGGTPSYGDIEECVRPERQFADSLKKGDIVVMTRKSPRFPNITKWLSPTCVWQRGGNIINAGSR